MAKLGPGNALDVLAKLSKLLEDCAWLILGLPCGVYPVVGGGSTAGGGCEKMSLLTFNLGGYKK